jgi:hypothetical protein
MSRAELPLEDAVLWHAAVRIDRKSKAFLGVPMKHHLLTVALLLAAFMLYVMGLNGGGSLLLLVGAALELWFWVRAVQGRRLATSSVAPSAKP